MDKGMKVVKGWARFHDIVDFKNGVNDLIMVDAEPPENNHLFNQSVEVLVIVLEEDSE